MSRKRLRIGIAGLGLASALSLPEIAKHPRVRIAAATDLRPHAVKRFVSDFGGQAFPSVESMCESRDIDVVYVSTPNHLHAKHATMAAENGKHVIVEKPMATSVQECDSIIESVGRNGVVLVYGHTHAYDPPIQAISELVGKAKYGRMTMFNSWNFTDLMVRPRDPWELDVTHGGGIAFIHAPHQIDIAREIGGPISQVHARTGGSLPDRPTEGHYIAYFEYDSGIPGTLVSSSYGYFDTSELHYWADESGRQRGRDASKDSWGRYRERRSPSDEARAREGRRYGAAEGGRRARRRAQPFFGLTVVSCERADLRQSRRGLWIYDSKGRTEVTLPLYPTGRQLMIDELAAAIAGRSPVVHDGEWGRATVAACLAIRQSAKAGNPVSMRGEAREAAAVLSANTGSEP